VHSIPPEDVVETPWISVGKVLADRVNELAKSSYSICVIRGDGIGPEIIDAALSVLEVIQRKFGFNIKYIEIPAGDSALEKFGDPLPPESVEVFAHSDACLKGPVGRTVMDLNTRLRFAFDLYANIRPVKSFPGICPPALRPNIDITVIRENSEGFYRALENEIAPGIWTSTGVFTEKAAKRIADFAFHYAESKYRHEEGRPKVTLATKANIFRKTHSMYLKSFETIARVHDDVEFEHLYADALCARLVREPERFDVIVSENLIADLVSDLAGQIAGGLGMTPGTNINYETKHAYFEPTHGSAPDIAGSHGANPIGQIRSAELMLQYLAMVYDDSNLNDAAISIERAIERLLNSSNPTILPIEVGGKARTEKVAQAIVASLSQS
jgi:isocitrate/isopropylmalate dehydrogenase